MEHVDALSRAVELLADVSDATSGTRATSVRLPAALHELVMLAGEQGWEESFTAAVTEGLTERIRDTVRREAIVAHIARFPDDAPTLAQVAARRITGTPHVGVAAPDVLRDIADRYELAHPTWAVDGVMDRAVDEVLDRVELVVALTGTRLTATG